MEACRAPADGDGWRGVNLVYSNYQGDYLTRHRRATYTIRLALRVRRGWVLMYRGQFVRTTRDEAEALRFVVGR